MFLTVFSRLVLIKFLFTSQLHHRYVVIALYVFCVCFARNLSLSTLSMLLSYHVWVDIEIISLLSIQYLLTLDRKQARLGTNYIN